MKHMLLTLILAGLFTPAQASDGPFAPPCPGCPGFDIPPYPHTGLWYSPEHSGTGINIDVQNGTMGAVYYGYRDDGEPIWYLFSGKLQLSEADDVYWELEAGLYKLSNGEPINGEYQRPDGEMMGTIHVEIMQRHLMRFSIDGGPYRRMASQFFGSRFFEPFGPDNNVRLPDFAGIDLDVEGDQPFAPWLFVYYAPRGGSQTNPEGYSRWGYAHAFSRVHWGRTRVNSNNGIYTIRFSDFDAPPHIQDSAEIECGPADVIRGQNTAPDVIGEDPLCQIWTYTGLPDGEFRLYYMPLGNLGDRRFSAVSEDGWMLEGFRLRYD